LRSKPRWIGIYVVYILRCHLFVVILCSDDAFPVLQNAEHARGRTQARQRGTQDTTQGMLQPTIPLFLYFQYTVDRQILIFVWLVIPSLKNFTFRTNNIAIDVRLGLKFILPERHAQNRYCLHGKFGISSRDRILGRNKGFPH
jgi:hypothetical protein